MAVALVRRARALRALYLGDTDFAGCLDCHRIVWCSPWSGRTPRHLSEEDRDRCPGYRRRLIQNIELGRKWYPHLLKDAKAALKALDERQARRASDDR